MFPYALNWGMTYEQYWEHDPWLFASYRKAHELQNKQRNQEMWMQGLYVYEALAVVLNNAFRGKSGKEMHYLKEPIPLTEEEVKERKERDARIANAEAKAKFEVWAESLKISSEGCTADGNND